MPRGRAAVSSQQLIAFGVSIERSVAQVVHPQGGLSEGLRFWSVCSAAMPLLPVGNLAALPLLHIGNLAARRYTHARAHTHTHSSHIGRYESTQRGRNLIAPGGEAGLLHNSYNWQMHAEPRDWVVLQRNNAQPGASNVQNAQHEEGGQTTSSTDRQARQDGRRQDKIKEGEAGGDDRQGKRQQRTKHNTKDNLTKRAQ